MDINLLKKLIKVVENSEISEFLFQEGDLKVKISKNNKSIAPVVATQQILPQQSNLESANAAPQISEPEAPKSAPDNDSDLYQIKSPIVGTFYSAPAPDADLYVQVGDQITEGSVLCIVEAMKLMNEIESDVNGKLVKILVKNGTPVEYNQPLFLVEKS